MIKGINKITKIKEVKTYELSDWNDLRSLDYDSIIPKNAKSVEITCKKNFDRVIILAIDYVADLKAENLREVEE